MGDYLMSIKDAVVLRIKQICEQKNLAINALANLSGLTPSTVYSIIYPKHKDVGIVSLKKLCDGMDISMAEFFDSDIFHGLEQEVE